MVPCCPAHQMLTILQLSAVGEGSHMNQRGAGDLAEEAHEPTEAIGEGWAPAEGRN